MTIILNLTQHKASAAQIKQGVFEPANKAMVEELLLFTELPTTEDVLRRAKALANLVIKFEGHTGKVMIGGAPYLMGPLEAALKEVGCVPVYAFSNRESIEEEVEGKLIKRTVFVHKGFVEA